MLASALPVLGVDASLLRVARLARMVHLLRHVSHLRLARLRPSAHEHPLTAFQAAQTLPPAPAARQIPAPPGSFAAQNACSSSPNSC
jgi:hypothetical protein